MTSLTKDRILISSKFFEVFNHLDGDQLNKLIPFFKSFSHNLNPNQQNRFIALIEERKKGRFLNEQWAKKYIWKEAAGEWNKNKSTFQQVIDRFLLSDLRYKDFWGNYTLLKFYKAHQLVKNFNLLWNKCEKKIDKKTAKGFNKRMQLFLLYELKTSFNKGDRRAKRKGNLQLFEENLDAFYALQKLRIACEQLNRKAVIKKGDHSLLDAKLIETLSKKLKKHPIVQLYFNIYQLLKQPKKEVFYAKASELIQTESDNFSGDVLLETTELLMNYCSRKIREQKLAHVDEFRKHIEFLLDRKLLINNGLIDVHHFNNYVSVCLIQDNLKKLRHFIKSYGHKITPSINKKQAKTLSQLRYHLYQLEPDKCWQLISEIRTDDKVYNFLIDKIYLKLFLLKEDQQGFKTKLANLRGKLDKEQTLHNNDQTNIRNLVIVLNLVMSKKKTKAEIDLEKYRAKLSPLDYAWLKKAFGKKS